MARTDQATEERAECMTEDFFAVVTPEAVIAAFIAGFGLGLFALAPALARVDDRPPRYGRLATFGLTVLFGALLVLPFYIAQIAIEALASDAWPRVAGRAAVFVFYLAGVALALTVRRPKS